jgi:hypothetical protein
MLYKLHTINGDLGMKAFIHANLYLHMKNANFIQPIDDS